MGSSQYIKGNILATSSTIVNINRFVNFLKSNTNVIGLILRCSRINYEGIKELAQLAHLASLNLSCNYVSTEGAKILASGNLINLIKLKYTIAVLVTEV
ncbi:MAG: hypothetical protein ACR5KV_03890 [Wolbachia sp.]